MGVYHRMNMLPFYVAAQLLAMALQRLQPRKQEHDGFCAGLSCFGLRHVCLLCHFWRPVADTGHAGA